ncbi:hypothetical protein V6N11_028515 [Hibiscus sabdariffa]|uniref:Uncharacterized protein n=1 Tax=Hibiscus sabdariffa TaxID=183260 RepID=A0ABR2NEN3_9ROSI
MASRVLTARGWPKIESSATTVPRQSVVLLRAASFFVVCCRRSVLSDPFGTASTVLASRPQVRRDYPLSLSILSQGQSLGAGTSSPCGTSGPPRLQGSAFTTFDAHWFRPPMGSSGKRGQLPTSVVPNQQTHPRTGRLYGTYYTLNAIPHPSLSTASKHLERSRLSRLAGSRVQFPACSLSPLDTSAWRTFTAASCLPVLVSLEDPLANTLTLIGVRANTLVHLTRSAAQGRLVNSQLAHRLALIPLVTGSESWRRDILPVRHLGSSMTPRFSLLDHRCSLVSPSHGLVREAGTAPDQCASKHLERSRLSRLAGRDILPHSIHARPRDTTCHGVRVLAQGHPPRAAPRVLHDSKVQPLPPSMLTGFALPWARQGSGDSSRPVWCLTSRPIPGQDGCTARTTPLMLSRIPL